jgi:hypothetical protein
VRKCLLSFGAEYFVFQFAIQKLQDKVCRNIICPFVLYGCESWSLKLGEQQRLRVFGNRVLRRILQPTRYEVTAEWRKLHIEELNDLYCLPNIVRVIKLRRKRLVGHAACMGRGEAYTGF